MVCKNIFDLPIWNKREEFSEDILKANNVRIERIISAGHKSAEDFWYDQDENEFVVLLEGCSTIEFEDGKTMNLTKGDSVFIPMHQKHRIVSTSLDTMCFWLAVFYK